MNHSIRPGQIWLDCEGKRIQAHGGSVITVNGKFYWYGENKEKTTGEDNLWHWGGRCYSSTDLYNWADDILGPYKMVNKKVNPHGNLVGDFDLVVDEESGKGYIISQKPHTCIYCADLNEEYTDVKGEYSEHFSHTAPPEAREAPACFMRNRKRYMITSGTTGYYPNPSEVAMADSWHGSYEVSKELHKGDSTNTSFNSQISSVFKHPFKKDLYIAIADRWRPDAPEIAGDKYLTGEFEDEIQEKFRKIFDVNEGYVFTEEDAKDMRINSSVSDYVWLPLRFEENQVFIDWKEEWKIENYE